MFEYPNIIATFELFVNSISIKNLIKVISKTEKLNNHSPKVKYYSQLVRN